VLIRLVSVRQCLEERDNVLHVLLGQGRRIAGFSVERRLSLSRGRFTAAIALLLVLPLATQVPAIAALALVTGVWLALHVYELVWWREARTESRSMLASS